MGSVASKCHKRGASCPNCGGKLYISPKFVRLRCPGWIKTGGSTAFLFLKRLHSFTSLQANDRHAQPDMAGVFMKSRDIKRHHQTVTQK